MPAERFTKKADTAKKKRQWTHIYNTTKAKGASPASAIRQANSALAKKGRK